MEGLGYGEVDMDDAQRIDKLERDVTQLKEEVDISSDHRPYERMDILERSVSELRMEIATMRHQIAMLKQQQPSTVHHHYHNPGLPGKKFTSDLTSYGVVRGAGHWDSSSGGATA